MRSGKSRADGSVWGLVSDVHGNFAALEHALQLLTGAGAQRLAFLGDYLGRGDSDRCVQRIREVGDLAVLGNRDLDWQDRVSPASKAWVLGLPRVASIGALLVSHGDARLTPLLCTSQIPRDFRQAFVEMERRKARVWAFGHSHHARSWRKADGPTPAEALAIELGRLDEDHRYFVNVGTTGRPFPGKGGPSVAIVDFERAEVRHLLLAEKGPE